MTTFNRIKGELAQLLNQATVLDWDLAEDPQIQEAIRKVDKCEDNKLQLLTNWEDYKSTIYCLDRDQVAYA